MTVIKTLCRQPTSGSETLNAKRRRRWEAVKIEEVPLRPGVTCGSARVLRDLGPTRRLIPLWLSEDPKLPHRVDEDGEPTPAPRQRRRWSG